VRVTVHPQSTVHSLVEFVDGSILAQISVTDMRLPILYALAYPERPASSLSFDLAALRHLDFEPPDFERFPCLRLAFEAAEIGGAHTIALNAADEIAVEAFLNRQIPFNGIPRTIEAVLAATPESHPTTIAEVLAADRQARQTAHEAIAGAQPDLEFVFVKRLYDVIVRPGLHPLHRFFFACLGCEKQDIGVRFPSRLSDSSANLRAGHARHDPIQDRQPRCVVVGQYFPGSITVGSLDHFIAPSR